VSPAGRPEIGEPINIRLGDLLSRVDAFAEREQISRAEAIRRLVAAGLDEGANKCT
jgi:metal-responsive CopG/Arc/MetJ family transcriptional regulator